MRSAGGTSHLSCRRLWMWLYHLLTWGYELASGAFCRARYTLRSSLEAVNLQTAGRALIGLVACRQAGTTIESPKRASMRATTAPSIGCNIALCSHAAAQAGQLYGALVIQIKVFQSKLM